MLSSWYSQPIKGVPPDFAYSSQYLPNLAYRLNRPRRIYWYQQFFSKVRGSKDTRGRRYSSATRFSAFLTLIEKFTFIFFCKLSLYFIFSLCFRVRNNVKKRPFKLNDFSPAALFDNQQPMKKQIVSFNPIFHSKS